MVNLFVSLLLCIMCHHHLFSSILRSVDYLEQMFCFRLIDLLSQFSKVSLCTFHQSKSKIFLIQNNAHWHSMPSHCTCIFCWLSIHLCSFVCFCDLFYYFIISTVHLFLWRSMFFKFKFVQLDAFLYVINYCFCFILVILSVLMESLQ